MAECRKPGVRYNAYVVRVEQSLHTHLEGRLGRGHGCRKYHDEPALDVIGARVLLQEVPLYSEALRPVDNLLDPAPVLHPAGIRFRADDSRPLVTPLVF